MNICEDIWKYIITKYIWLEDSDDTYTIASLLVTNKMLHRLVVGVIGKQLLNNMIFPNVECEINDDPALTYYYYFKLNPDNIVVYKEKGKSYGYIIHRNRFQYIVYVVDYAGCIMQYKYCTKLFTV